MVSEFFFISARSFRFLYRPPPPPPSFAPFSRHIATPVYPFVPGRNDPVDIRAARVCRLNTGWWAAEDASAAISFPAARARQPSSTTCDRPSGVADSVPSIVLRFFSHTLPVSGHRSSNKHGRRFANGRNVSTPTVRSDLQRLAATTHRSRTHGRFESPLVFTVSIRTLLVARWCLQGRL